MDTSNLQNYETIWTAAGSPFAVFALPAAALKTLTGGQWIALAEE